MNDRIQESHMQHAVRPLVRRPSRALALSAGVGALAWPLAAALWPERQRWEELAAGRARQAKQPEARRVE